MIEFNPLSLISLVGKGIDGAGNNKYAAALSHIALILLAFNSQQCAADNTKILVQLADLKTHIEDTEIRVSVLENDAQPVYTPPLIRQPKSLLPPTTKGTPNVQNLYIP